MNDLGENLQEYLEYLQVEIKERMDNRNIMEESYAYPETTFTRIALDLLQEHDLTGEAVLVQYHSRIGSGFVKVDGYFLDEDDTCLDLFITNYISAAEVQSIGVTQIKKLLQECIRFLEGCAHSGLEKKIPDINNARELADTIHDKYQQLEQLRIFVLTDAVYTDRKASYDPLLFDNKIVNFEIIDLRRLSRMDHEGNAAEPVNADCADLCGSPLPFISVSGSECSYECLLTSIPGNMLLQMYAKHGVRLLEANVRSFLGATVKVNGRIRDTLIKEPDMFLAYNNGLVMLADGIETEKREDGLEGIKKLENVQIVNGGQTTASIFFTERKRHDIALERIQIAAKIIILKDVQGDARQNIIANISKYANSQNSIKASDLSSNNKYHIALENVSKTVYTPDGKGLWFYERASGAYKTMLARFAGTAQQKRLKTIIPTYRKLTKTDVAKFINAWNELPHIVSLGAQKNYAAYIDELTAKEQAGTYTEPDADQWKRIVALAILYKSLFSISKKKFKAFQGIITTYTISSFAYNYRDSVDLMEIWKQQKLPFGLTEMLTKWAEKIEQALYSSAQGRMLSEWAKKEACWDAVRNFSVSMTRSLLEQKNDEFTGDSISESRTVENQA